MTTAQSWKRAKKLAGITNLTVNQARTYLSLDQEKADLMDVLPFQVAKTLQSEWGSGKIRGVKALEGIEKVELQEPKPISPEEILIEGYSIKDLKKVLEIVRDLGVSEVLRIIEIIDELELVE